MTILSVGKKGGAALLWKQGYKTEIETRPTVPPLAGNALFGGEYSQTEPQVLILCWNLDELTGTEIWWRLLYDAFPACPHVNLGFICESAQRTHLATLDQSIPVSRHRHTYLWRDPEKIWIQWTDFSADRKVAAVLIKHDGSALIMKGLPTEEAWERFEREFRAELELSSLPEPQPLQAVVQTQKRSD